MKTLNQMIEFAAKKLPPDWEIRIEVQREYGEVVVTRPDGSQVPMQDGESGISEQFRNALIMIGEEALPRSKKQKRKPMKMTDKELRELDNWIHENVMHQCLFDEHRVNNALCRKCGSDCSSIVHRVKSPTTNAAAAMEVLRRCLTEGFNVETLAYDGMEKYCAVTPDRKWHAEATTLELAICLLAKQLFSK